MNTFRGTQLKIVIPPCEYEWLHMKSKSNPNLENAVSETHNGTWTLLVMDFCVRVALLLLVVNLQKKKKGKEREWYVLNTDTSGVAIVAFLYLE